LYASNFIDQQETMSNIWSDIFEYLMWRKGWVTYQPMNMNPYLGFRKIC